MTLADSIIYSDLATVKKEAEAVAHLNFYDEYGYTPLIQTGIMNQPDKAALLLEMGADANMDDLTGNTALHWAVENNNLEFAKLLLENGADANAVTRAGQPVLFKPLLRRQKSLVRLLLKYKADLTYARDWINTKLLGHRFELLSAVDIIDHMGRLREIEFEGFFLEFSIELMIASLKDYQQNFAARDMRDKFKELNRIINAFLISNELVKFQHYQTDLKKHKTEIDNLLNQTSLIIPVAQEGHALAIAKHGNLLALCDRMQRDDRDNDVLPIYVMNKPEKLTPELVSQLIYEKQPLDVFHKLLPGVLGLEKINELPMPAQITGNCSWANLEACVPALFFMQKRHSSLRESASDRSNSYEAGSYGLRRSLALSRNDELELFYKWRQWDQDRILHYFFKQFETASVKRRWSFALIFAQVLFQTCVMDDHRGMDRAMRILTILKKPEYEKILKHYLNIYTEIYPSKIGDNLKQLIRYYDSVYF